MFSTSQLDCVTVLGILVCFPWECSLLPFYCFSSLSNLNVHLPYVARYSIVFRIQFREHVVHPSVYLSCNLVQCFSLNLLTLQKLLHHSLQLIWRTARGCRSSLWIILPVLKLILSLAEDEHLPILILILEVWLLISSVLELISLRSVVGVIWIGLVREKMRVIPHISNWMVIFELPTLT